MAIWQTILLNTMEAIFGDPLELQFFVLLGVALFCYLFLAQKTGELLKTERRGMLPTLVVTGISVAVLLAVTVIANLRLQAVDGGSVTAVAVLLIASLGAVIIPLHCLVHKTSYARMAGALTARLAGTVLAVMLTEATLVTMRSGVASVDGARNHRANTERGIRILIQTPRTGSRN